MAFVLVVAAVYSAKIWGTRQEYPGEHRPGHDPAVDYGGLLAVRARPRLLPQHQATDGHRSTRGEDTDLQPVPTYLLLSRKKYTKEAIEDSSTLRMEKTRKRVYQYGGREDLPADRTRWRGGGGRSLAGAGTEVCVCVRTVKTTRLSSVQARG